MPFWMTTISTVTIQGRLYIGGGGGGGNDIFKVMVYDTTSQSWSTLPPYIFYFFAMTAINNQLLLVGGYKPDQVCKLLGVWEGGHEEWTHPYPEMPTARASCSAVVYNGWLAVAGGWADMSSHGRLSCFEVLNIDSKQWYTGPSTPTPWSHMKTTMIGGLAYFMGGTCAHPSVIKDVYCIDMQTLISRINSKGSRKAEKGLWKVIPGLQLTRSTPLSIKESLLAFGGRCNGKPVTTIHLYQPHSGEWMKVGDLLTPRRECACALTTDREIMVVGGGDDNVEFAQLVE